MKKSFTTLFFLVFSLAYSFAQQHVISEATINYNISVTTNSKEPALADIFDGATLTVYIKGDQALSEMKSVLRNQRILFNGKADTAIILRESGDQKFIINLNAANWKNYNSKYDGIVYTYGTETKTIADYICKKATGKLKNGTEFTVYYAPTIIPLVKGYDYQFKDLPGLALEYEVQNGDLKVKYSASKISFAPIPQFKFDIPKSGYRILDYQQKTL